MYSNHIRYLLIRFAALCLLIGCNIQNNNSKKIVIATSANMQPTMHELTEQFVKETGVECQVVVSSSGKLTAQIKEGAPYDIFVSADMKYPQEVYNYGKAYAPPQVYAYGKLVLWTLGEEVEPVLDSETLESIGHFAITNPKTAPYGVAAIEVLNKTGLLEDAEDKLVYGCSADQEKRWRNCLCPIIL